MTQPQIPAPLSLDPTKVDTDIGFLLDIFREVLQELGVGDVAAALPWGDAPPSTAAGVDQRLLTQAVSIAFRLITLAEENASAQHRRMLKSERGPAAISGLWGRVLGHLTRAGLSPEEIARGFGTIEVEPVLTAHPTEAKRATVLEQHRELYLNLVARENQMWTVAEQRAIRATIKAGLERLWRTGDIFLERPEVADELRAVVHYLVRVFPEVVPRLDAALRFAWQEAGCRDSHDRAMKEVEHILGKQNPAIFSAQVDSKIREHFGDLVAGDAGWPG